MRVLPIVASILLVESVNSGPAPPPKPAGTQVEMVNVRIRLDAGLILNIRQLHGRFIPTRQGQPPTFDDKQSYEVAVDSAVVGVSLASMTHAMNMYIFG